MLHGTDVCLQEHPGVALALKRQKSHWEHILEHIGQYMWFSPYCLGQNVAFLFQTAVAESNLEVVPQVVEDLRHGRPLLLSNPYAVGHDACHVQLWILRWR